MRPEDKDPIPLHPPIRQLIAWSGLVTLRTEQIIRHICFVFNARSFRRILRPLRDRGRRCRMILVCDYARHLYAVLVTALLCGHAIHLRLQFLAPYSPDLASIGRLWKAARPPATRIRYIRPSKTP